MNRFDLFHAYRYVLGMFLAVYATFGLLTFLRRWVFMPLADRSSRILWRYAVVLLLRAPFRCFLGELLLIVGLLAMIFLLIRGHIR